MHEQYRLLFISAEKKKKATRNRKTLKRTNADTDPNAQKERMEGLLIMKILTLVKFLIRSKNHFSFYILYFREFRIFLLKLKFFFLNDLLKPLIFFLNVSFNNLI